MEKCLETFFTLQWPYWQQIGLQRCRYQAGRVPQVALTAGLRGTDLVSLLLCHQAMRWLDGLGASQPDALQGEIAFYPALNPLALYSDPAALPLYETDLSYSFPGHAEGPVPQRMAAAIVAQLTAAHLVIDLQTGEDDLVVWPQVHVFAPFSASLLPFAKSLGLDLICLREQTPPLTTTLPYVLNQQAIPCLAIQAGAAAWASEGFVDRVLTGLQALWQHTGVLSPRLALPCVTQQARIFTDTAVYQLRASVAGLFMPTVRLGEAVPSQALIGHILSPLADRAPIAVQAPRTGRIIALRHTALVYEGSVLARILH